MNETTNDLNWIDNEFTKKGDNDLIEAPGVGKKILILFYRKASVGNGQNRVSFHWEGQNKKFFDGNLWYAGVDAANLVGCPRSGPENKKLLVNLSSIHAVSISIAYKIVDA
jgi:hypothetical protein